MIPEGWIETRFGNVFAKRTERGTIGLPTMSVTINDGLVFRDSIDRKMDTSLLAEEHLLVRKGDIAYNMMRMWQGSSGLAEADALVSPAYVVLRPTAAIDPLFAAYLFKHPRTIYLFWAYSYGLTEDRLRLYFADFSLIPICLPTVPEQRRIAEILTTWDLAIGKIEALIANAAAQKKALMQSLLTGKHRLPGFSGAWKQFKIREFCDTYSGGTPSRLKSANYDGGIPWIKSGELNQPEIHHTGETISEFALKNSSAKMVTENTILIAMYGATAGVVSISKISAAINQAILAIIPNREVSNSYLMHALKAEMDRVHLLTQGGQPNLNAGIIGNLKIAVPPRDEQEAISALLDDASDSLIGWKSQLTAFREEKDALMQQLLTGKRRVKDIGDFG